MSERRKSIYCEDCGCYIPIGDENCPACGMSIHYNTTCMPFYYDTSIITNADFYVRGGRGNPILMAYYQDPKNICQIGEEQKQILMNETILDSLQHKKVVAEVSPNRAELSTS